ncbi:hypothetical protein G7Z17_g9836 [Cylindrodendrum hubeiense]|uniref:Uncharacterized protein n=1 Tax=Cylindrodendrum hubeiense TaxID=595255 RepID=A0A9P5H730_9HYPO|nr:hypothetical protein G7Z17_g9836 [Cylindrodendrum hubeiense]
MASSNPVPSRTAIHALRGVLLTTSCSVILLAEERRQRLKIARAAIDNAKKLHTVRVNHNSIALSESYGRRDAYPAELGDFSTSPIPRGTIRRRRRNGQPPRDSLKEEDVEQTGSPQPSNPSASLSPETPETRQKKWDEWDLARKELSRMSAPGPFAHNELFLRLSTDDIAMPPITRQPRNGVQDAVVAKGLTMPMTAHSSGLPAERNPRIDEAQASKDTAHHSLAVQQDSEANALLRATQSLDHESSAEFPLAMSEDTAHQGGQVSMQESLVALDRLVVELESPGADRAAIAGQLDSAIELLGILISSEFLESKSALSRGLRILQSAVGSQEHSKMPAILDTLRPACGETCLLAVPAMDSLHSKCDTEGVSQLLKHLFQSPMWKPEDTPHNQRNTWVTRLLMHYWRKTHNFTEINSIYSLLQDAGLFADGFIPLLTQYAIRRRIALIALDAGDDAAAKSEMKQLRQLRPKAAEYDIKLRGRFAIRDASLGNWETVWSQVQSLKIKGKTSDQYQNVLSWLTKIYCKDHSSEEIDLVVRNLVDIHGMTLNQPLAFLVLDRHARNRDTQSLVRWLQFCHNGGLEMNQIFFNEIVDKCCKYWNLARVDVVHMLKGVRSFMPWVHDPHVAKYSVHGALSDLHKSLPGEDSKGDDFGMVSKLPSTPGDSLTVFERTAFRCMNTWALEKNWQQVYDAFKEASEKGIGFSSRCLRLAVIANINIEGPHSRTATELVGKAHVEGHDISSALVPLLVARLESGDDVGSVLQQALSQGAHVHDSVYNKAARILTQNGFQEGAVRVCELAAQQNGKGQMAYNQFNFASLVFSYTGQRRYHDLRSLLANFTSKSEWWQGSKECKESLKRAMKAVATRVSKCPPTDREMHEEVLTCLNQAFEHVKTQRATVRQDRVALTEKVVGVFKQMDHTQDLDSEYLEEETPVERRTPTSRMSWEAPTTRSRDVEQLEEDVYQDGQTRTEQLKSLRSKAEPQQKVPQAAELANEEMFTARWQEMAHG